MLHPPASTGEGSSPRCLGIKRSRLDPVEAGPELHQLDPARPRLVRVLLQPVPVLLRLDLVRPPLVPEAVVRVLHQQDPVARQEGQAEDPADPEVAPEVAVVPQAVVQAVQAVPAVPAVQADPAPVVSAARLRAEVPAPVREAPMPRLEPVRERARARAPVVPVVVPDRCREFLAALEVSRAQVPEVLERQLVPALAVLGPVTPVPIR